MYYQSVQKKVPKNIKFDFFFLQRLNPCERLRALGEWPAERLRAPGDYRVKSFLNLPDYCTPLSHPKQIPIKIYGWNKKTNQSDFTGFYHKSLTSFTGQLIFNKSSHLTTYVTWIEQNTMASSICNVLNLSPIYRLKLASATSPWTGRKGLPRSPLEPAETPPADPCFLNPFIAHIKQWSYIQSMSMTFTNNFWACLPSSFTDFRVICSVSVKFITSFFQVSTFLYACVAAMDARPGFETSVAMFLTAMLRWHLDVV